MARLSVSDEKWLRECVARERQISESGAWHSVGIPHYLVEQLLAEVEELRKLVSTAANEKE